MTGTKSGVARVVHCKREPYDIYIGRGPDPRTGIRGKWGNPYSHDYYSTAAKFFVNTREDAIEKYREWIQTQPKLMAALPELRGKVLGCWCKPRACHGDVLVELVENPSDE